MVSVGVTDGDDAAAPARSSSLAGADGGLPVEQPAVDELPSTSGARPVVTQYDLDDDGAIWATVCGPAGRR
ncbi:hypothetical protein QP157_20900 [Sphingomonas sp. LR61]|uniref:hypothetical protein n=1 Tax=Sphingomonas sp. LR61 TaxID=3050234 RepID=UPI002FE20B9E